MSIKKYPIIYADPPWRYSAKKVQGAAENHYPTMSIDELCALPVAELAAKDSALFMWATFPQLPEALRLIRAWGFTYGHFHSLYDPGASHERAGALLRHERPFQQCHHG